MHLLHHASHAPCRPLARLRICGIRVFLCWLPNTTGEIVIRQSFTCSWMSGFTRGARLCLPRRSYRAGSPWLWYAHGYSVTEEKLTYSELSVDAKIRSSAPTGFSLTSSRRSVTSSDLGDPLGSYLNIEVQTLPVFRAVRITRNKTDCLARRASYFWSRASNHFYFCRRSCTR